MNHNVGIWIDHKKAVVVSASADGVTATTVQSDVGAHGRYAGAQDGGGEKKYEERHDHRLAQFFDEVIQELKQPDAVLIFGPGEAKLQLEKRLGDVRVLPRPIVQIEAADKLTDAQIVAKVTEHYRLAS